MFADLTRGFGETDGTCFYWALAAQLALTKHGIRAEPRAGSASWRRAADDVDDGMPPHLFYEWDDDATDDDIEEQLTAGCLPEIHIWTVVVDTDEIVDLSTPFLPAVVAAVGGGAVWTMPTPGILWAVDPREVLECGYTSTQRATKLAARLMSEHLQAVAAMRSRR